MAGDPRSSLRKAAERFGTSAPHRARWTQSRGWSQVRLPRAVPGQGPAALPAPGSAISTGQPGLGPGGLLGDAEGPSFRCWGWPWLQLRAWQQPAPRGVSRGPHAGGARPGAPAACHPSQPAQRV